MGWKEEPFVLFMAVLFGNIGNTRNVKKQGQWLTAPANLDQHPIPVKGCLPHVCLLRSFVRGFIYAVAKIILLACRCFVNLKDLEYYFPKQPTLPERAEQSSWKRIDPFAMRGEKGQHFGPEWHEKMPASLGLSRKSSSLFGAGQRRPTGNERSGLEENLQERQTLHPGKAGRMESIPPRFAKAQGKNCHPYPSLSAHAFHHPGRRGASGRRQPP